MSPSHDPSASGLFRGALSVVGDFLRATLGQGRIERALLSGRDSLMRRPLTTQQEGVSYS